MDTDSEPTLTICLRPHSISASFHSFGTAIRWWSSIAHSSFALRFGFELTMALRFATSSSNTMRTDPWFSPNSLIAPAWQPSLVRSGLGGLVLRWFRSLSWLRLPAEFLKSDPHVPALTHICRCATLAIERMNPEKSQDAAYSRYSSLHSHNED